MPILTLVKGVSQFGELSQIPRRRFACFQEQLDISRTPMNGFLLQKVEVIRPMKACIFISMSSPRLS